MTTKNISKKKLRAKISIRWYRIVGLGYVLSTCFISSGIASIEDNFSISRLLLSSNYTPFPILFCLLSLFSTCFC